MKKSFLLIMLFFTYFFTWSQSQTEFEKFVDLFYLCNYPYIDSYDYDKMTKVNTTAIDIDEDLLNTFVYGQGIKPVPISCKLEDFEAYDCYIQFPSTDSVFALVLSPDMRDPSCGEGSLLATYSKYNYRLQGSLWISLRGAARPQHIDDQVFTCNIDIESVVTEDSICLERKETHCLRFDRAPKGQSRFKKLKIITYNMVYKMTVGGKFIKIKEDKKEEIIDPLADKIKEPLIREYETDLFDYAKMTDEK
jgi:hypothetical protein